MSLGVDTDDNSIRKAQQRLEALAKSQEDLSKQFARGDIDADRFSNGLKEIRSEATLLNRALDSLEKPREIDIRTERFDKVSRDVSLAGDTQSNLGSAAALAGGSAGQAIGVAGELAASVEELARLKLALAGLPQTIAASVAALGPVGVAMAAIGAAGVALVNALDANAQKNADAINRNIESLRKMNQEIYDGTLTTEEANRRIDEANRKREAEEQTLKDLQAEYDRTIESQGALGDAQKLTSREEEARAAQIKESEKLIQQYKDDVKGLNAEIDAGRTAIADRIAAERELAQFHLDEAGFQGDLAEARARAVEMTREQIDAELERLYYQQLNLEGEKAYLEGLDELTKEQQDRIDQINEDLTRLEETRGVYENARAGAQSEADLAEARQESTETTKQATAAEADKAQAEQASAQAARELEQAQAEAARRQEQYTKAVNDANTKLKQARQDIGINLSQGLADANTQRLDDLADLEKQFGRDELKRERQKNRDLKKIQKDADKEEADALKTRNFLRFADVQEQEQEASEELLDQYKAEGAERLIEAKYQSDDLIENARRTTRDLRLESTRQLQDAERQRDRAIAAAREQNSMQDQALRASLNGLQQYWQQFMQLQQQALGGTVASGQGGSNRINNVAGIENIFTRQAFGSTL